MPEQIAWEMRYRSPIAATKGVDTQIIYTDEDSEAEAREVAQDYLDRFMSHPSTKLVYVRHAAVWSARQMKNARKIDQSKAAGKTEPEGSQDLASVGASASRSARVGQ